MSGPGTRQKLGPHGVRRGFRLRPNRLRHTPARYQRLEQLPEPDRLRVPQTVPPAKSTAAKPIAPSWSTSMSAIRRMAEANACGSPGGTNRPAPATSRISRASPSTSRRIGWAHAMKANSSRARTRGTAHGPEVAPVLRRPARCSGIPPPGRRQKVTLVRASEQEDGFFHQTVPAGARRVSPTGEGPVNCAGAGIERQPGRAALMSVL